MNENSPVSLTLGVWENLQQVLKGRLMSGMDIKAKWAKIQRVPSVDMAR